jgi:ABC-type antimicrobial peptide transport system permease subunit
MRRFVSSVALRVADPAATEEAIAYINGPAVQLDAKRETAYYDELSRRSREIVGVTGILIAIMAIGAAFGVANTMYAAVDGRRREIAMLRTLGFQPSAIVAAVLIESLLICSAACIVGLALSLSINGLREDFLSDTTWTVLAYELRITPAILAAAFVVSSLVGVAGAMAPALRAARTRVIEALRKA